MIRSWKDWWHSYRFTCGHEGKKAHRLIAVVTFFAHIIRGQICAWSGHKIVDESYGNSEHGEISGYCIRCGWSYREILY